MYSYKLKQYKNSKTLRIRITNLGKIIVTAPTQVPLSYIKNFIQEKSSWISEKLDYITSLPTPHIQTKKGDYKKYKESARIIVKEKIKKMNSVYGFLFNNISIRNQKSRWGSCSNKKNLNFNYKIIFLPDHLIEYIVAHELCHLKEMNHGPKFWELVSKTFPEYKKMHKELRNFKI